MCIPIFVYARIHFPPPLTVEEIDFRVIYWILRFWNSGLVEGLGLHSVMHNTEPIRGILSLQGLFRQGIHIPNHSPL